MLPGVPPVVRTCLAVFLVVVATLTVTTMPVQGQAATGATPIASDDVAADREAEADATATDVSNGESSSAPQPSPPDQAATENRGVEVAAGPSTGTGSVLVQVIECNDAAREGQTDFFVGEPVAAADADTSGPCSNRRADGADYTLRGISVAYAQTISGRDGFLFFPNLAPGTYQLGNDATGIRSPVFDVLAFEGTDVVVYEFEGFRPDIRTPPVDDPTAPATASVRVDICTDAARPGDTDFRIFASRNVVAPDFADTNRPGSIAAICRFAGEDEVTVVLRNVATGEERQATTDSFGGAGFGADIPPGAYTFSVTASDGSTATSTSFTLEPGGFIAAAIYLFVAPDPTPTATMLAPKTTTTPPTAVRPTAEVTTRLNPTATATPTQSPSNDDAAPTATAPTDLYVTTLPSTGGGTPSPGTLAPWLVLVVALGLLVVSLRTARDGR
jgi:hypothetical protein